MPATAAPVRPTLLFAPGWAFDASFWTPLANAWADWPQAIADAGYFGPAHTPAPAGPPGLPWRALVVLGDAA